ncbi:MAG TPA: DUF4395 domain-containing protein [Anaerolineae bacterium]
MSAIFAERRVDHSALRVNQAFIIGLLVLAFLLNSVPLVAFVSLVMLAGTVFRPLALFQQVYLRLLRPLGIVSPDVVPDNPEPHRFAQGFGGAVLALAVLALVTGGIVLGWALAWLVVALAAANLFLGFCAGCFLYYQLNRLGVPGFTHSPLPRE